MLEAAMRLYAAKLVDLERMTRDDPEWSESRRREFAIDYAVSDAPRMSLALPAGQTITDVEAELRRRVGLAEHRAPETAEQAFERRRVQGRGWQLIVSCLHDPAISAMFRALRDQCADPERPTDLEAENCRLALLAEIAANGVAPRGVTTPATTGELEAVGAAIGLQTRHVDDQDEDLPW